MFLPYLKPPGSKAQFELIVVDGAIAISIKYLESLEQEVLPHIVLALTHPLGDSLKHQLYCLHVAHYLQHNMIGP